MPTAFILSPGAPVAYPQAYMLYNPSVGTQQYFAGGFGQPGQYPGFQYGTSPQGQGVPTHGPQQPVGNMPVPPPPPQASGNGPHGTPYGSTPTSPMPPKGSAPAPPRQKKILRIENPDTHEVLNLSDIKQATSKPTTPLAGAAAEQAAKSFKDVALSEKKLQEEAAKPKVAAPAVTTAMPPAKPVEAAKKAEAPAAAAVAAPAKEEPAKEEPAKVEPKKETPAPTAVAAPSTAAAALAAAVAAAAAAVPVAKAPVKVGSVSYITIY